MPIKSYQVGNQTLDIPEEKNDLFKQKYPDAKEIQSYTIGKDTLDIPIDKVDAFKAKYTDAKPLGEYADKTPPQQATQADTQQKEVVPETAKVPEKVQEPTKLSAQEQINKLYAEKGKINDGKPLVSAGDLFKAFWHETEKMGGGIAKGNIQQAKNMPMDLEAQASYNAGHEVFQKENPDFKPTNDKNELDTWTKGINDWMAKIPKDPDTPEAKVGAFLPMVTALVGGAVVPALEPVIIKSFWDMGNAEGGDRAMEIIKEKHGGVMPEKLTPEEEAQVAFTRLGYSFAYTAPAPYLAKVGKNAIVKGVGSWLGKNTKVAEKAGEEVFENLAKANPEGAKQLVQILKKAVGSFLQTEGGMLSMEAMKILTDKTVLDQPLLTSENLSRVKSAAETGALFFGVTHGIGIGKNLMDLKKVATAKTPHEDILAKADELKDLGIITPEEHKTIQKNVVVSGQAKDILNVDQREYIPEVQERLAQLLSAKDKLSASEHLKEANSGQIKAIKAEIAYISENKKMAPETAPEGGVGRANIDHLINKEDGKESTKKANEADGQEGLLKPNPTADKTAVGTQKDEVLHTTSGGDEITRNQIDELKDSDGNVSVSRVQRTFKIGYNAATEIIDKYKALKEPESEVNLPLNDTETQQTGKKDEVNLPKVDEIPINDNSNLVLNKDKSVKKEDGHAFDNNWYDVKDNDGNSIGNVEVEKRDDRYRITNIKLDNPKKGLGTDIYTKLALTLDKPLYSDSSRSESANALWDKLVKKGVAEKVGEDYRMLDKESIQKALSKSDVSVKPQEGKDKTVAQVSDTKKAKVSLSKRLKGDKLLDAEDLVDELNNNKAEINNDGTVTLYHRTTKENADAIVGKKEMVGLEDGVFFSTAEKGQAEGYGDVVVKMKVPIESIELDDTFGNEAHVRIPTKKANQKISVSKYSPELLKDKVEGEVIPEKVQKLTKSEQKKQDIEDAIKKSKSAEEAFKAVHKIKDVPQAVSQGFAKKYNPNGKKSPLEAFTDYYNDVKKPVNEGKQIEPNPKVSTDLQKAINEVSQTPDKQSGETITRGFFKTKWGDLHGDEGGYLYANRNGVDAQGYSEVKNPEGEMQYYLEQKGYVEYTDKGGANGKYQLTEQGKEFVKAVDARLETRKGVKEGTDLFPENANIPEFENAVKKARNGKPRDTKVIEKASGDAVKLAETARTEKEISKAESEIIKATAEIDDKIDQVKDETNLDKTENVKKEDVGQKLSKEEQAKVELDKIREELLKKKAEKGKNEQATKKKNKEIADEIRKGCKGAITT
jgi:hypothetical protein